MLLLDAEDEWRQWQRLGDPVMHIDLRDWADVMVLAPLSAHTLAKITHGLCDDVLTSVVRAWDWGHGLQRPGKPLVVAPAMNTAMWEHPLTSQQLTTLQSFWNVQREGYIGVEIVAPQVKTLACGEVGNGALADVKEIVDRVSEVIALNRRRRGLQG
jgi:phosphopantothenoylcysteine decarboxylase